MVRLKFDYEKKIWGGGIIRLRPQYFSALRLATTLKVIKSSRGRLLDLGCGAGDYLEAVSFYRPEWQLYGLDWSRQAIDEAKKRKIKARFIIGDVQRLPFANNRFDMVLSVDLLEHVDSPEQVLKEIFRVLKPKGKLQLFVPIEANLISIEGWLIKLGWRAKEIYAGHIHQFSKPEITKKLIARGFKLLRVSWEGQLIYQLAEIGYFFALSLRRRNSQRSVEGWLGTAKPGLKVTLLTQIKNLLATILFCETKLCSRIPGMSLSITAAKVVS